MCKNLITIKHKNLVKVKIYSKKAETSNKSGIFFPIIWGLLRMYLWSLAGEFCLITILNVFQIYGRSLTKIGQSAGQICAKPHTSWGKNLCLSAHFKTTRSIIKGNAKNAPHEITRPKGSTLVNLAHTYRNENWS